MSQYKITQEEFKIISELKNRFGNISLVDLYNQSTVIDENGNPVPKISVPPIEETCKTLTDKQIEDLLHERIGRMCIYAHYDLAEHGRGLFSQYYNGVTVECTGSEPKMIKSTLEARNYDIKLVVTVVKTIRSEDWSGPAEHTFMPVYDRKGLYGCGNVIFLDKKTGKFHAMPAWVGSQSIHSARCASGCGLNQFMSAVDKSPYFQNKILTQLSDTLRYARGSHR